jgi:hypothetical protein
MKIITRTSSAKLYYILRFISFILGFFIFFVFWKVLNTSGITSDNFLTSLASIGFGLSFLFYAFFQSSTHRDEFVEFFNDKVSAVYRVKYKPKYTLSETTASISLLNYILFPNYDEFTVLFDTISKININTYTIDLQTKNGNIYSFPVNNLDYKSLKAIKSEFANINVS